MQDLLIPLEGLESVPEQRIELLMLQRIDDEQKALANRVVDIDKNLRSLGRELSEIKGSIKPPAETPTWISFFLYPICVIIAAAMVSTVITLEVQMHGVKVFLQENAGFIAGLKLQREARPDDPKSIAAVQQILSTAKARKIAIPQDVIESIGKQFVDASRTNVRAWSAALDFLEYRSSFNGLPSIIFHSDGYIPPGTLWTQYSIPTPPGENHPHFTPSVESTDISQAAEMGPIVNPPAQVTKVASKYLLGQGGAVILDGQHLRQIVLENVAVHYNGGPLILENVTFINCRFIVDNLDNGRSLGAALLAASQVTIVIGESSSTQS